MKRCGSLCRAVVWLGLCLGSASSAHAAAPTTKEACISAFDRGQQERRAGHLRLSREELLLCSRDECPAVVRADCTDVLRQVDAALPTIVLSAKDARGRDVVDVTVTLGEERIATTLDGRAVTVDPGKLTFVFRRPPWTPVTIDVLVVEGEKGRIVQATLDPPRDAAASAAAAARTTTESKRNVVGWALPATLAAVGIGALAVAGITRLQLESQADDLKATCAPKCPADERDQMSTDLVTANVMLGIGIGSVALAVASWFIFAPKSSRAIAARPVTFTW